MIEQLKYFIVGLAIIILIQVVAYIFNLHISNVYLDRLLWYTFGFNALLSLLLLGLALFLRSNKQVNKNLVLIPMSLIGILCSIFFIYSFIHVIEAENDTRHRMEFHATEEWHYYANTTRRSALDDLDIYYVKERSVGTGLLVRRPVTDNEMELLGFQPDSLRMKYNTFYRFKIRR